MFGYHRKFSHAFLFEKRFTFEQKSKNGFDSAIGLALETDSSPNMPPAQAKAFLDKYLDEVSPGLAKLIRTADENGNQPLMEEALERLSNNWQKYLDGIKSARERIKKLSIHEPAEEMAHFVSFFRSQAETVIKSVQQDFVIEELKEKIVEDELTGLLNKRGYSQRMESRIARCKREKTPLTLLFTDIDHFKHINDTYGHDAGNEVLKEIAKRFVKSTRSNDLVCRWGGEEFAIILDDAGGEKSIAAAARIMEAVTKEDFTIGPDLSIKVTISIGGRDYEGDRKDMEKGADHDLYVSKGGGKEGNKKDKDGLVGNRNSITFNNKLFTKEQLTRIRAKFSTLPPKPRG